ncbi:hypothetical protein ACSHT0_15415 [Tepidicaulis sp. LMO-SS28]|uniref:hypothetical protein n=1 Tax=Tepidicaulis sp. LMO-SS28 TaxID=3447455 RepID=UPI003EDFABF4
MTKPKSAPKPAAAKAGGAPAAAANEDSPEAGQLYRLITRRPSRSILWTASLLSLLAAGAVAAYLSGRFTGGALPQSVAEAAPLLAAVLAPVLIIWLFAWLIWRGQEMRLMAEALARTAMRITEPDETARARAASLADHVRGELKNLEEGLDALLSRAATLDEGLATNLDAIDRSTTRAELRSADLVKALGEARTNLETVSRALGGETDTLRKTLSEQTGEVRTLTGKAEETMSEAAARLRSETETLSRVSEAATTNADATTQMLDRQSSRLEVVAETALGKAESLSKRYDGQREAMREAVEALEKERILLDTAFSRQRETIETTAAALAERTKDINDSVSRLASGLEDALGKAGTRTEELTRTFRGETASITASVAALEEKLQGTSGAIAETYSALRADLEGLGAQVQGDTAAMRENLDAALTALSARLGEETEGLRQAGADTMSMIRTDIEEKTKDARETLHDTAASMEKLSDQLSSSMFRVGGAARDAGRALGEATEDLEKRIGDLPAEALEGAKALREVLEEQIEVLASIAEIVVRHARVFDKSPAAPQGPAAPQSAPRRPAPASLAPHRDEPKPAHPAGRWNLSDLLSAARRSETREPAKEPRQGSDLTRASLHIVEALQSLAIDLDRALEQSPPPDLWRRYQAGERNVFTRRLYNLQGRNLHDRITERYDSDAEFREDVDRFISLFEDLLETASAQDRDNILADTYLTSDTGKVYLMLAAASGRLS